MAAVGLEDVFFFEQAAAEGVDRIKKEAGGNGSTGSPTG
jgi:hypothetical protein